MSIGAKIKKLRIQNNKMSQEELAYKLGVAQTTISNIEANKVNPDFSIIEKICDVFDINLDYFSEAKSEKYIFKNNENNNILVGKVEILNNTMPEGFLEKIMYRLEKLEKIVFESNTKGE